MQPSFLLPKEASRCQHSREALQWQSRHGVSFFFRSEQGNKAACRACDANDVSILNALLPHQVEQHEPNQNDTPESATSEAKRKANTRAAITMLENAALSIQAAVMLLKESIGE